MKTVAIDRSKAILQDTSPASHFEGEVRIQPLASAPADGDLEYTAVFFNPGAHTKPHIHERAQYLQVMEGKGTVVTESEQRLISPGELVVIPGGLWHWHGAVPGSAMMHLSIRVRGATDWDVPATPSTSGA